MGRAYSMLGEMRNMCKILVGMPKGKRLFRRLDIRERVILICDS
jgi:hypothetical protein